MEIVCRSRRNGKTLEAIKKSAKTGSYLICRDQKECHRVAQVAREMGIDINFPISFDEFLKGLYSGRRIKGFVVDNADMLLQSLTHVPIKLITLTEEENPARP
jgi:hypothetical protein